MVRFKPGQKNTVITRRLGNDFVICKQIFTNGGDDGFIASLDVVAEKKDVSSRFSTYKAWGATPVAALFALRQAVADGENGWTWKEIDLDKGKHDPKF